MIVKVAWYDFNFLKFTKALLVAQCVVNPRECSLYTWEKCVFCCFWTEFSININDTLIDTFGLMTHVSFKACVSWLVSCLDDLSIDESGVSKSPIITVLLSLFPFMVVTICLTYWGASMLDAYIFKIAISSSWIYPLIIM